MKDSIFTKIIKGEIPSYKIFENEDCLAFLDIHPIQPGHTLVIPKKQIEFVWELQNEDYINLMNAVKLVANRLKELMDTRYVGMQVVGLDVPHAHVSVIPFNTIEEFRAVQDMSRQPDESYLEELANKLMFI